MSDFVSQFVRPNIQSMRGYVPGEQPQTGKFIKLNTNENPYPPSESIRPAVQAALEGLARYPDAHSTAFRLQASRTLGVPEDWILCGNGSDDILTILTRTFVGQEDAILYPTPSYVLYETLAQIQGASVLKRPFREDWKLAESFCEPDPRIKLVYLANPNSPSGTVLTPDEVRELARRLPYPFLVDEAYVDFAETHCVDLVREFPHVMVSRTLSKSYSLAGLRFGFVIARPEVIQELSKVKDSYNCDSLSIAAATAALSDTAWLEQTRTRILKTRAELEAGMSDLGFQVTPSQANFVWSTHSERSLQSIYEQLKAQRILVRYMNYDGWGEGLRVSVGTDDQNSAFLTTLRSIVK